MGLSIMANRAQGNCIACHDIPAWRGEVAPLNRLTLQGNFGPSLQGVGKRYSPQQLRQWIVDARVMRPDTLMPPYGTTHGLNAPARSQPLLSDAQIDAVAATLSRFMQDGPEPSAQSGVSAPPEVSTSAQLQSVQDMNPVVFWVEQGRQVWTRDCAACHAVTQVAQTVPHFPRLDGQRKLINLEDQILQCRQRTRSTQRSASVTAEDRITLGLSAFLHELARGQSIWMDAPGEPAVAAMWQQQLAAGEQLFNTRMGHMNLSCRQCHEDKVGASMRAFRVTSGHPIGFPAYRISWQGLGSIERRIRACFSGVQAQVPAAQDPRLRQLELYLKYRARGMAIEGPAVRP